MIRFAVCLFRKLWYWIKPSEWCDTDQQCPPRGRRGFELHLFEDGIAYYSRYGLGGHQSCQLEWNDDAGRWVLQGYQNNEDFSGIHT